MAVKTLKKHKTLWHKFVLWAMIVINVIAGVALMVCSYSGLINPIAHPLASVPGLVFPICLSGCLLLTAFSFIIRWKSGVVGVAFLLACLPSILNFSPLRFKQEAKGADATFTLLTYNVCGYLDQTGLYQGDVNPTLNYIIKNDADIVCLQEAFPPFVNSRLHTTAEQIDSLHKIYQYIYLGDKSQMILSKYPVTPVNIDFDKVSNGGANMACFRVDIDGENVTIFNVHLQSFKLAESDREMYMKLTKLKGSENEIDSMQRHLISKIAEAAPRRVDDTEHLVKYIKKYGGPNVIVCGDFNDVPGCYSLRMLEKEKLRQVYPEVGFGPMITYNSERFYFRIDHILYRGNLRPLSMGKGKLKSSDHYPVEAKFEITKD